MRLILIICFFLGFETVAFMCILLYDISPVATILIASLQLLVAIVQTWLIVKQLKSSTESTKAQIDAIGSSTLELKNYFIKDKDMDKLEAMFESVNFLIRELDLQEEKWKSNVYKNILPEECTGHINKILNYTKLQTNKNSVKNQISQIEQILKRYSQSPPLKTRRSQTDKKNSIVTISDWEKRIKGLPEMINKCKNDIIK